jgi:hypothetical protein
MELKSNLKRIATSTGKPDQCQRNNKTTKDEVININNIEWNLLIIFYTYYFAS